MSRPPRPVNPKVKTALELGPVLAFFAAYLLLRDREVVLAGEAYEGFVLATALFVPLMAAATLALWRLTGHLSRMQLVTLGLVVVFGGMSVWFNDERFFKIKPTIIYTLFGAVLGLGLLRGTSYLQALMEGLIPLRREGWMILTRRFMWLFFGFALANEVIWRTMSTETWVTVKTFGFTAAMFVFFMLQGGLYARYGEENGEERGGGGGGA